MEGTRGFRVDNGYVTGGHERELAINSYFRSSTGEASKAVDGLPHCEIVGKKHWVQTSFVSNKKDVESVWQYALEEGPWNIMGHYLTVRKWQPDFRPELDKINRTAAWVRPPGFPLEHYNEHVLMAVGNALGRALMVDANTMCSMRGRFARICIELDLDKPLVPKIDFNRVGTSLGGGKENSSPSVGPSFGPRKPHQSHVVIKSPVSNNLVNKQDRIEFPKSKINFWVKHGDRYYL